VQVTCTGGWPSVTDGASKWKSMPPALTVRSETFCRHARLGAVATGGGGGGGVGAVGLLHDPATARQNTTAGSKADFRLICR
jgi:hypothetical protein